MPVSLPFKRDIQVSFGVIAVQGQPGEIFGQVENIEWEYAQLELLPQVDLFVVQQDFVRFSASDQYKREQGHPFHMQYRRPQDETSKSHLGMF